MLEVKHLIILAGDHSSAWMSLSCQGSSLNGFSKGFHGSNDVLFSRPAFIALLKGNFKRILRRNMKIKTQVQKLKEKVNLEFASASEVGIAYFHLTQFIIKCPSEDDLEFSDI